MYFDDYRRLDIFYKMNEGTEIFFILFWNIRCAIIQRGTILQNIGQLNQDYKKVSSVLHKHIHYKQPWIYNQALVK